MQFAKPKMKVVYNATITGDKLDKLSALFTRYGFTTRPFKGSDGKITEITVTDYTTDMSHEVVGFLGIKGWWLNREIKVSGRRQVPA